LKRRLLIWLIFSLVAGLGCACDLVTKWLVFEWLGGPGERPVFWLWQDRIGFQTTLNEGALFGMGQGLTFLFVIASFIAVIAILVWVFFQNAGNDLWLAWAAGAICGGILGNLYDRLGLPGLRWEEGWIGFSAHRVGEPVYAVRDFILVMIGRWPWPTFNIADSLLVVGVTLLVIRAIFCPTPEAESEPSSTIAQPD